MSVDDTGIYFLIDDYKNLSSNYTLLANVEVENPIVFSLGYGGHFYECAAVFYSAAALVGSFDGVAFDPQGGSFMKFDELIEAGKQCHELAKNE